VLGIIGGSGLYDLPGLVDTRWVEVDTPWGAPSDAIFRGRLVTEAGSAELAFLPRHGRGHRIPWAPPTCCRCRPWAGCAPTCRRAPSSSSTSSSTAPRSAPSSFFGRGLVAHVSMADPVCPRLGDHVERALQRQGVPFRARRHLPVHGRAAVQHQGRSALYRSWNCSVIGMTNLPEAKLAREAELCYASVGMVTDFDCWHPAHDAVTVDAVIQVLLANAGAARALVAGLAHT
jgi:5'-methylthioadenosine phosphorylase